VLVLTLLGAVVAAVPLLERNMWTPLGQRDFDQVWEAARALRQGLDPYAVVGRDPSFPFRWPLYYPLTAVLVAFPFSFLPFQVARLVFAMGGGALLGYALGRYRPWAWPILVSASFLYAVAESQWSPYLTAALLLPAWGWISAAKPNLGLAILAGGRTRRAALLLLLGGLALTLTSLAIMPRWPLEWLATVETAHHFRPLILRTGGVIVLLALLRWRDPDARLLLVLALVPQNGLYYDVLPALLVARTRLQTTVLALCTLVGGLAIPYWGSGSSDWAVATWETGTLVFWTALIPPLVLVLLRPAAEVGGNA
jgi:hypothetical protein